MTHMLSISVAVGQDARLALDRCGAGAGILESRRAEVDFVAADVQLPSFLRAN